MRKNLNMRKGKMVAHGAHASMHAILQLGHAEHGRIIVALDPQIKKICVSVNSEAVARAA